MWPKGIYINDDWKRAKVDGLSLLIASCLKAEGRDSLRFSSSQSVASVLENLIPSHVQYTVFEARNGEFTFEVITERSLLKNIIPALIRNGAKKIIVSPLGWLLTNHLCFLWLMIPARIKSVRAHFFIYPRQIPLSIYLKFLKR